MEQYYNYLDYHFEKYGSYCRGGVYRDEMDSVEPVEAPARLDEVIAYFKRRDPVIKALGNESYETVWKHPDYKHDEQPAQLPHDRLGSFALLWGLRRHVRSNPGTDHLGSIAGHGGVVIQA